MFFEIKKIRLATRRSRLALVQTSMVVERLKHMSPSTQVEVVHVTTRGDRNPYGEDDLKAAFTEDIDKLLLNGEVDAAVHSLKDVPSELDEDIIIASTPFRSDPRDVLVSESGIKLEEFSWSPKIGTSSQRRAVQIRQLRQDAEIVEIHGNVDTRLRKYREIGLDALVMSASGLERLNLLGKISQYFDPDVFIPAPCQGIIAIEARRDRKELIAFLKKAENTKIRMEAESERTFSLKVGGDCKRPVGAIAQHNKGLIKITGFVAFDGKICRDSVLAPEQNSIEAAKELAEKIMAGV
jgi:hydroxymethylbilane synthase